MRDEILRTFRLNLEYARRLVSDVPDVEFCAQPVPGLNHATWIAGHLAVSFQAIGGEMGLAPWLPATWQSLFGTGSRPDPDPAAYPPKADVLSSFEEGAKRVSEALARLTDADLARPLPDERYRHVFPTLGSAVLHILTSHMAVHLGQLSAWRRALGLPPVEDPL